MIIPDGDDLHDDEWFASQNETPYAAAAASLSVATDVIHRIIAASLITRMVYGIRTQTKQRDWNVFRRFFGWKSASVVAKTFAATTQFAKNTVRLPMRAHFMPRFPALNVRRLQEVFATDTFFSATEAHDGSKMCQLFVGKKSYFTEVVPMTQKSEFPNALKDFVRKHGAMQGLMSDNAPEQISDQVHQILRQYNIKDMQSEPYQQNQNPAERRIQEVKAMTTVVMDRSGAPKKLWLLCLLYCVYILNRLAHVRLDNRTPLEICFGPTPDISAQLCFAFYEAVYFHERNNPFPDTKECVGRFVGIVAENKGDALTFKILTEDDDGGFQIIDRSVVRPVDD